MNPIAPKAPASFHLTLSTISPGLLCSILRLRLGLLSSSLLLGLRILSNILLLSLAPLSSSRLLNRYLMDNFVLPRTAVW